MAVLSFHSPCLFLLSLSPSIFLPNFHGTSCPGRVRSRGRRKRLVIPSAHSNPRIIKTNRKSRYGQTLSPYDTDEDTDLTDYDDEEHDDRWFSDGEERDEIDADKKRYNSQRGRSTRQGMSDFNQNGSVDMNDAGYSRQTFNKSKDSSSSYKVGKGRKAMETKYPLLFEEIDLDEKWLPLLDYLSTFGLRESHFIQMYQRHMPSLQINAVSARERLDYLLSVGVKQKDLRRIILRQPQILEYTVENNLKSHVSFLVGLGIPDSRVGQILTAAPSLFSYSVENSLKPTVRYLIEEIGIRKDDLGKVVQLSPQILVQRIDVSWSARLVFLSKELGAPKHSVVKMVRKHPQILHYSIEDGLLPRINFLRSIGMGNEEILKVLTSLTQVFSLSLEDNIKPKYMYLVNELRNEAQSLTKYPTYLSLSLEQRIRPRHRFLVALKKAPKGPFPLSSLVPTDESFCQQWAGTSLDKYLAFRQRLLLKDFAKKYERRG